MYAAGELLGERCIDGAMPVNATHFGKGRRYELDAEVRFARSIETSMVAGIVMMAGMEMAFVHDLQLFGGERRPQFRLYRGFNPHPASPGLMSSAPEDNLLACQFLFAFRARPIIDPTMKLDSKYFDRIRVKPDSEAAEKAKGPTCSWAGCEEPGLHKAPMGRNREGAYYHFCVDHVRLYNKSYNYFSGLNDTDIQAYLKDALTGHRPTWSVRGGAPASASASPIPSTRPSGRPRRYAAASATRDPFNLFGDTTPKTPTKTQRKARSLEIKALQTLDLPADAGGEAIRVRYKALVKQYHPDANGGDRGHEDRLRDVIQAYKLLKQSGFC